jgi:hypothetical protein
MKNLEGTNEEFVPFFIAPRWSVARRKTIIA